MPANDRLSPQGVDGVWPAAFLKSPSSEIRDLRPLLRFFGDPHARQVLWAFTQKWPHLGPGLLAAELPRHLLWGLEAPRLGLTRATIDRVITTGRHLGMLDSELRGNRDGSDTVRMACAECLRIIAAAKGMKGEEEVLEVYAMAGVLDVTMRLLQGPATRAELSRAVDAPESTISAALGEMKRLKFVEYLPRGTAEFVPTEQAAHRTLVAEFILIDQAIGWARSQRRRRNLEYVVGETASPMVDGSLDLPALENGVIPREWAELTAAAIARREGRRTFEVTSTGASRGALGR